MADLNASEIARNPLNAASCELAALLEFFANPVRGAEAGFDVLKDTWPSDLRFGVADLQAPAELAALLDRPCRELSAVALTAGLTLYAGAMRRVIGRHDRKQLHAALDPALVAVALKRPAVPAGCQFTETYGLEQLLDEGVGALLTAGIVAMAGCAAASGRVWLHALRCRVAPRFTALVDATAPVSATAAAARLSWLMTVVLPAAAQVQTIFAPGLAYACSGPPSPHPGSEHA